MPAAKRNANRLERAERRLVAAIVSYRSTESAREGFAERMVAHAAKDYARMGRNFNPKAAKKALAESFDRGADGRLAAARDEAIAAGLGQEQIKAVFERCGA